MVDKLQVPKSGFTHLIQFDMGGGTLAEPVLCHVYAHFNGKMWCQYATDSGMNPFKCDADDNFICSHSEVVKFTEWGEIPD